MKVVTTQQMSELELFTRKIYSLKENDLMENAGCGIARWIQQFVAKRQIPKKILIVSGRGNNGGDSFVAGRYLIDADFDVEVIILSKETEIKGPARQNYSKLKKKRKVSIVKVTNEKQFEKIKDKFKSHDLLLDGMLGTGIRGEIKGFHRKVIEFINSLSKTVISIDMPSGIDANTGNNYSIKAAITLSMGLPKIGLFKPGNEENSGKICTVDIGLPDESLNNLKSSIEYIDRKDFAGQIPTRPVSGHKGDFGHVLVLAGSPNYTGAAALCVYGAVKGGAGLVTLGVPRSLQGVYQQKFTEAMTLPLPETEECTLSEDAFNKISKILDKIDCIALGPGLSTHPNTIKLVKKIIANSHRPIVIDADGINAIAEELLVLRKAKAPLVLTPHPGEMARLLNTSTKGVLRDKWKIARELSDKYGITVLLKGSYSVIAGGDKKIYINSTGNPGMATGGMGDILTGLIASYVAQGFKPLFATKLGAYIHGSAGDMAAEEKGEWGIVAGDLLDKLPFAMNSVYGK